MDAIVSLPKLNVTLDGAPLAPVARRALGECLVRQALSLPSLCELVFFDPVLDGGGFEGLRPGAALRAAVEGESVTLFDGEITAVNHRFGPDGGRELRVRAYDRLHRLRTRQVVRTHVDMNLADLARQFVTDLDVDVQAADAGPVWPLLVQYWQSDFDLLRETAERSGSYFYLHDGVLQLLSLDGLEDTAIALALGHSLVEAEVDVNADGACREVETLAWDPWLATPRSGQATRARSGREVNAEADPAATGGEPRRILAGRALQDDREAEALAQAELDRRTANEVVFTGVANGNPALRPGARVEVRGLAPAVSGRYVLTQAVHRIDRRHGYLSELDTAVPVSTPSARLSQVSYGVVNDVADPAGLGRVRVTLPGFADVLSAWLEVLLPAAGRDKGIIALPDVGDHVLVLFADGDPAQGVVLGGLYGEQTPPDDAGVMAGAVKQYVLRTPAGQRVCLDDDARSVRIENEGGEFVEMNPDGLQAGDRNGSLLSLEAGQVRLHAATDLDIAAPGRAITIRGRSIDFERA